MALRRRGMARECKWGSWRRRVGSDQLMSRRKQKRKEPEREKHEREGRRTCSLVVGRLSFLLNLLSFVLVVLGVESPAPEHAPVAPHNLLFIVLVFVLIRPHGVLVLSSFRLSLVEVALPLVPISVEAPLPSTWESTRPLFL